MPRMIENAHWPRVNCPECGGLFFLGKVTAGHQKFKCRHCKVVVYFMDGELDKERTVALA